MGNHYSLQTALHNVDHWNIRYFLGLALIGICFYCYYWFSIKQARKDKASGMPWQTNMYNFANDFVFVVGFSNWFSKNSPTHHWIQMALWVGLVLWFIMEIVVHVQTIRYDLTTEIFPHAKSRRNALLMYWGVQIVFIAGYWYLWSVMEDPLVWIMFGTTVTGCMIFNFTFLQKRGSTRGMHPSIPYFLTVAMFATYFLWLPGADTKMSNFYTYFLGTAVIGLGIALIYYYRHLPKYVPEGE
ncbi:MAG: hypothetical protein ACI4IA_08855 [Acutalibacteraceae bacterium]